MGAYDQAIAAAQRALALATASGDVVLHALANRDLGLAGFRPRAIIGRQSTTSRIVASLEGARRHELFGRVILPAVISRAYLAWCYAEQARSPRAGPRGRRVPDCRGG